MKDIIVINDRVFEVLNNGTKEAESINHMVISKCNTYYYYDSIYTAYDRPSARKVDIWEQWKRWFNGVNGNNKDIWICSRNSNFFSIGFKFKHNGVSVRGKITPSTQKVVIS